MGPEKKPLSQDEEPIIDDDDYPFDEESDED